MFVWVYGPVSDWAVKKVPAWMAPNVVTLIGACFTFVPFGYMISETGT
jgi:ethanolaminephosphotransferase